MKKFRCAMLLLLTIPAFAQSRFNGYHLTVTSAPTVGSQATASVAAKDNTRHVADVICFAGGAVAAPAATALAVNLRDGASGAGTVLFTLTVAVPAGAGYNVPAFCANLPNGIEGSNNTAMTLEWSASLANESESVTLLFHDTAN